MQEVEQQQVQVEFEVCFEELDIELVELQEQYENGQIDYLNKEQQLNDVCMCLCELECVVQEIEFVEKLYCNKIEEFKCGIVIVLEQVV